MTTIIKHKIINDIEDYIGEHYRWAKDPDNNDKPSFDRAIMLLQESLEEIKSLSKY